MYIWFSPPLPPLPLVSLVFPPLVLPPSGPPLFSPCVVCHTCAHVVTHTCRVGGGVTHEQEVVYAYGRGFPRVCACVALVLRVCNMIASVSHKLHMSPHGVIVRMHSEGRGGISAKRCVCIPDRVPACQFVCCTCVECVTRETHDLCMILYYFELGHVAEHWSVSKTTTRCLRGDIRRRRKGGPMHNSIIHINVHYSAVLVK